MTLHLFTTWFTKYFKPTLENYCPERKFLLKYYCSLTMHLVTQELRMEMYSEITFVSMPANTASILKPMDQGLILTFKPYYLRNVFCIAVAVIDSDSSDGSGQSKLKIFRKGFTNLHAIKNTCDFMERFVQISTLTGLWKKLIPTPLDDFVRFKTSVEEVTADVVLKEGELE